MLVPKSLIVLTLFCAGAMAGAAETQTLLTDVPRSGDVALVGDGVVADIYADARDAAVTRIAAKLLSEDIERVTGHKPAVKNNPALLGKTAVIIGTIGKSPAIDALIESGKLDVSRVRGQWESSVLATIEKKDAFYEMVVYPIRCSALMNQKWLSNNSATQQRAYDQIQTETAYYNQKIAGGKWRNIMSADSRERPVYQKPETRSPAKSSVGWFGIPDGSVSIEAEHPTRQIAQEGTAWKVIPGLGLSGDSIALLPTGGAVNGASRLEYDFSTETAGTANIAVYCLPTHALRPGLQVRYSVSIDGGPASSVDLETKEFSSEWSENVLHGTAIGRTQHQLTPGKHTLKLTPLDPGMVFDKIVINPAGR